MQSFRLVIGNSGVVTYSGEKCVYYKAEERFPLAEEDDFSEYWYWLKEEKALRVGEEIEVEVRHKPEPELERLATRLREKLDESDLALKSWQFVSEKVLTLQELPFIETESGEVRNSQEEIVEDETRDTVAEWECRAPLIPPCLGQTVPDEPSRSVEAKGETKDETIPGALPNATPDEIMRAVGIMLEKQCHKVDYNR